MIIDIHGHQTTAPPALVRTSDDELRESIELNQLKKMNERGNETCCLHPVTQPIQLTHYFH